MRERPVELPAPVAEVWQWQLQARCRGQDSTVFFDYGTGTDETCSDLVKLESARRVCNGCPVVQACLDYAVGAHEPFGIWGGLTPEERAPYLWRARAAAMAGRPPATTAGAVQNTA